MLWAAVLCFTALVGLLLLVPKLRAQLWILFPPPKEGGPFAKLPDRPVEELVTDKAQRDKIIKDGFNPNKIPNQLDAIVIGSGMGGLTAAALLAKVGKRVVVLEQHDQAGGCCHVFVEKGFEFDVGIHYIGEMREGTMSRILVDQLTDGGLQWEPLEEVYDTVAIGEHYERKYPIHSGRQKLSAALIEKFPDEKKAINKYFDLLKEARRTQIVLGIVKALPGWLLKLVTVTGLLRWAFPAIKYFRMSLTKVLDDLTSNVELKAVLAYAFGDYGTAPANASFMMHALLVNHMLNGPYYPRGGASEIAFHMVPVIQRAGGSVLVRVKVKEILLNNEKTAAVGVRVLKGDKEFKIYAPIIISDAGMVNTYKKLLAPEVTKKYHMDHVFKRVKPGLPLLSVFIGLEGTNEELGLKATNVWAFTEPDLNSSLKKYISLTPEEARNSPIPLIFVSFPSSKDPTYKDRYPGKSTCAIVTVAPLEWFAEWKDERVMHRGDEYETLKRDIGRRMWHQVLEMYPHLEDKVEYFDVGTPLSNQFYLGTSSGEVYGLDHDKKRFSLDTLAQLRAETPIPGLYLTGQDVFVCGFSGAMYGGLFCVSTILKRNLIADLMRLKSELKKSK